MPTTTGSIPDVSSRVSVTPAPSQIPQNVRILELEILRGLLDVSIVDHRRTSVADELRSSRFHLDRSIELLEKKNDGWPDPNEEVKFGPSVHMILAASAVLAAVVLVGFLMFAQVIIEATR